MTKRKRRTNNDLQNSDIRLRSSNTNPTKTGGELRYSGRVGSSCLCKSCKSSYKSGDKSWMKRTRKCLRRMEHIRGHLWHRYSTTVTQVMVVTVNSDIFNLTNRWRLFHLIRYMRFNYSHCINTKVMLLFY